MLLLTTNVLLQLAGGSSGHNIQMIRDEDKPQMLHEERFTRVQRALDGRNVGLQQANLSSATRDAYSSHADKLSSKNRRAGVMIVEQDEYSPFAHEHETVVAQNNFRHAQDTLLLHQLDSGVIPERFIKSGLDGENPLHVSVVLSKYGIGDTRGICLGKW